MSTSAQCLTFDWEIDEPVVTVQGNHWRARRSYLVLAMLYAFIVGLYLCSTASAKPTQQDVFRSIEDNVGESHDSGGKILLFIGGGALLLVILAAVGRRQQHQASPKALNHPGKLLKEIRPLIKLKNSELKQLRLVAEQTPLADSGPMTSPLTLLLCPTILARAVQDRRSRIDRKLVTNLIRRIVSRLSGTRLAFRFLHVTRPQMADLCNSYMEEQHVH